jgi:hypothetical protein
MCKEFGWSEQQYNKTSRKTIVQFSAILHELDEMARSEAKKQQQGGNPTKEHLICQLRKEAKKKEGNQNVS